MLKAQSGRVQQSRNQDGLVAILAVSIIIILLSLVTLGFARIMGREYRQALDRDLSTRAYYAAESGINDARRYIAANPTVEVDTCTGGAAVPVTNLDADTSPTCILINPGPTSLEYPNLKKDESKVFFVDVNPGTIGTMFFSWQSAGGTPTNFAAAGSTALSTASSWNRTPILRITIYQTQGNADTDRATAAQRAGTYFLYPNTSGAAPAFNSYAFNQRSTGADGLILNSRCNAAVRQVVFSGGATVDTLQCNVALTGLAGNTNGLFVRMTPLYGNADVRVFGSSPGAGNGNLERLYGAQTAVDVTGKATDQLKRLRAMLEARPTVPLPFGGIESADEVCKRIRLVINQPFGANTVTTDPASPACAIGTFN